jgi:hypothetical protein
MAKITIDIPDNQVGRVVNAFCAAYGYDPDTDGPRNAFAKAALIRHIKRTVANVERATAEQAARDAVVVAEVTAT